MTATTITAPPTAAERTRPALVAEVDRMRALLAAHLGDEPVLTVLAATSETPLDRIQVRLGMSSFERDVLMLAAAVELDGGVAALVGAALGNGDSRPTFALAMAALPKAHWDALTPERPLRCWGLVEVAGNGPLATRPLSVDEHVLHTLAGLGDAAAGLDGLAVFPEPMASLTPSQQQIADELGAAVAALRTPALVRVDGEDPDAHVAAVSSVARRLGLSVLMVRDAALTDSELGRAATVLDREALLRDRLVVTSNERLLALLRGPVVATIGAGETEPRGRTVVSRSIGLPRADEQVTLWMRAMEGRLDAIPELELVVRELAHHYRLSARSIAAIADEWMVFPLATPDGLRQLTRDRARVGLGTLAEWIDPRATWDDLVVPEGQRLLLRDLARQVRHRSQVYDEWGFGARSNRGFGVTALFAGDSGTGKTMAAEVIAGELGLDLYRIDLSAVVSKYIGETEKNLRRLFDAAEAGGAVLLFDEADALFGKRSEVKDSHDRYANLEVAYLLQRMEGYRGLAILTTNLRSNVDRAFLRRLRFVVQFPFPDQQLREELWRRVFPAETPTEGLDPTALARLQVSGGSIHAIAVAAAFSAAADGTAVRREHVLHAAKVEYAKVERTLTNTETSALARGAGGAR